MPKMTNRPIHSVPSFSRVIYWLQHNHHLDKKQKPTRFAVW
jgi:hypothetical protein